MTAQKKQHLEEIKLHKLSHGGRDKRTWGEKKKRVSLFVACLFWQLRHGASLAVCLSGSFWSLFHTGGSLVFGSVQLAVNHTLGWSLTTMYLI